jgi:8-oxo-dGTP pyrophosphatase MutT (NUDIX family)
MQNNGDILSSAGIIFYRWGGDDIEILLGKSEINRWVKQPEWTVLGGRAEEEDADIIDTAVREFDEETASIFSHMIKNVDLHSILLRSVHVTIPSSKYRLYFVSVDDENLHPYMRDIQERFDDMRTLELPDYMKEMREIAFVPRNIIYSRREPVSRFVSSVIARDQSISKVFKILYDNNRYERLVRLERDRIVQERLEIEEIVRAQLEQRKQRKQLAQLEQERLEQERLEQERLEQEQKENADEERAFRRERWAREKEREKKRLEQERLDRERLEREHGYEEYINNVSDDLDDDLDDDLEEYLREIEKEEAEYHRIYKNDS